MWRRFGVLPGKRRKGLDCFFDRRGNPLLGEIYRDSIGACRGHGGGKYEVARKHSKGGDGGEGDHVYPLLEKHI